MALHEQRLQCRLPLLGAHEYLAYTHAVVLWPKTVQPSNSTKLPREIYKLEQAGGVVEDAMTGRNNGNGLKNLINHGHNRVGTFFKAAQASKPNKDFPILKDHPTGQGRAESAAQSTYKIQGTDVKIKKFQIYRWNRDKPNMKPFLQSFFANLTTCGPMVSPFILFSLCLIDVWYSLISCLELDWLYINLV